MSLLNTNIHLNVLSSFKGNEQTVIADANNNSDFSDDKVYKFNKKFRDFKNNRPLTSDKLEKIDTLPKINISQQFEYGNKKINLIRKVQIFPFSNYYYTQLLKNGSVKDLALMMRFKDYWSGLLEYNSKSYDVGLQGINKDRMTIMIKPQVYKYKKDDKNFNKNFEYKINDTIQLDKDYFKIDSIDYDISQLFLDKLIISSDYYGKRIGNNIRDFELNNLKGESFNISDIINNSKNFTLIDFWGTWCSPCRKLTPELKRIYNEYNDRLNIIGIASDKNIEDVKDYIVKNKLEWPQAFADRTKKNVIIKQLKISSFPTFILIDKTGKVIYRGGSNSLYEIENFIKTWSNKQ
jgi:thiol-disulfide isomerase/thioredoxin